MPPLRNPLLLIVAAGITALLGVEYLRLLRPAQAREVQAACRGLRPTVKNPKLGTLPAAAPDFAAQDHTGKMVKLSDFRGKVVVVRFFASWCDTCKAEQPSLEDLAGDIDTSEVVVLAPSSDDVWDKLRKKFPDGSQTTLLLDPPVEGVIGAIAEAYGVQKVPETFLVDRDGIIRYYLVNKRDWKSSVARTCLQSLIDT